MIHTCVFTGPDPRPSTVDHIVVTKGWGMSGLLVVNSGTSFCATVVCGGAKGLDVLAY